MLNVAVIMGRLVADPELRHTSSDLAVTSFTVAVDRRFSRDANDRQADFIDVVAWRQTAEFVCRYFQKGSMIAVNGSIQTRLYEDKNGNKRKSVEIVAENVSFTGSKKESGTDNNNRYDDTYASYAPPAESNRQSNAFSEPTPAYSSGSNEDFEEVLGDDDLPF